MVFHFNNELWCQDHSCMVPLFRAFDQTKSSTLNLVKSIPTSTPGYECHISQDIVLIKTQLRRVDHLIFFKKIKVILF